jgi:Zn-dependent protease
VFLVLMPLLSATPFADLQTAVSIPVHALQGALEPRSVAQSMIADYVGMAAASPLEALCRLLLMLAVWNLLPLPPLAGGHALMTLAMGRVSAWPAWASPIMSIGVAVILMLYALWAYALIHVAF